MSGDDRGHRRGGDGRTGTGRAACVAAAGLAVLLASGPWGRACTGITLRAKDGAVVFGRTMEWGTFDLKARLTIVPRGVGFRGMTPDGKAGLAWTSRHGAAGMDAVGKGLIIDGMNETGLCVNAFYLPGFTEYQKYDADAATRTIGPLDVCTYLLTTCATVKEAEAAISAVTVVAVNEPAIGIPPPVHYIVTEPSGKAIVIEFTKAGRKIHETPLGVITNSPTYDWHEINLRNYVNVSPVDVPDRKIGEIDFRPLGGGSGMIGLPGDFTPPSRFVRATAFAKTARPTDTGDETFYEVFRILDNFNVPLGASEGEGEMKTSGLRSSTAWTTAYDTKNLVLEYHTEHNRRIRRVDLKRIDFAGPGGVRQQSMDRAPVEDIEDVTPASR